MWLTRIFIILSATGLVLFFGWPWLSDLSVTGDISLHAGTFNAQIPAVMGIFATLGLAAMLMAVRR